MFIDADLEDFSIYRAHRSSCGNRRKTAEESPLANELVSLHEINERKGNTFTFDGVVCYGDKRRYLQQVPFEVLSIGGYGETVRPTVGSEIWIQSARGKRSDIWYRLRTPSPEYCRFHQPFLWIADLAKNVVDFLMTHQEATLHHFRETFYESLQTIYESNEHFISWCKDYGDKDFRHAVVAHANFLFCQASQVDANLEGHPLWSEVHPRLLKAVSEQVERGTSRDMFAISNEGTETISRRKTTVTPYVYDCFKHLPWAKFLYCQTPSVGHTGHIRRAIPSSRCNPASSDELIKTRMTVDQSTELQEDDDSINVGDVVTLPLDTETAWKTNDNCWYAYVQGVTDTQKGRELSLLWLYRASDTECLQMRYPFANELFLSDHCNCGDTPIYAREVQRKVRLAFFAGPYTQDVEFFVRQKYVQGDGAWTTLQDSDFTCSCGKKLNDNLQHSVGDTLLVKIGKCLEPAVSVTYNPDGLRGKIQIRRLLRKQRDCGYKDASPNELVLTDRLEIVPQATIDRICHVRFYSEYEKKNRQIPSPYDRRGTGDCYYITSKEPTDGTRLEPLTVPYPALMKQGWDPLTALPRAPMLGLDIFCGGGNFGRGLEEGGAVEFEWAVDWYNEAIHTYRANLKHQDEASIFHGSVNDFLTQAMQGKKNYRVAPYGEVEVIAAGSPCQGFSRANPLKGNDRALFNVSMVASVVAFVDFYRPKYALLENVKGMATGSDTENVLAQVVCSLVGMGYQVRTFGLDAWNFGSPQSRSRVFIAITAPGLMPLPEPPHTHSHPENTKGASLGKTANGLSSSSRYSTVTPFDYVTAAESACDLPQTDGRTASIPFPDHRESRPLSTLARVGLSSVPKFPGGSTFVRAKERGYMPNAQIDAWPWDNPIRSRKDSRSWQRVRRNALMPTVLTKPMPDDGLCGNCVHWDEDRLLTIMEVRRGQGFPDNEILIGALSEQWKMVGNSVARTVALALGMSLRTVWLANYVTPEDTAHPATTAEIVHELGTHQPSIRPELVVTDEEVTDSRRRTMDILKRIKTSLADPQSPAKAVSNTTPAPLVSNGSGESYDLTDHTVPKPSNPEVSGAEKLCDEALNILSLDENDWFHASRASTTPRATKSHHDPYSIFDHDENSSFAGTMRKTPSMIRPFRFITNETTVSKVTITETTTVERSEIEMQL